MLGLIRPTGRFAILAVAAAINLVACGAIAAPQPNPLVEIAYIAPKSSRFQPIHDRLKEKRVLERLSAFLSPIVLPSKLPIRIEECGALTKVYTRKDGVVICYEFVARIEEAASQPGVSDEQRRQDIAGAFVQSTLYRVALGLLDKLDVPVWGRYTDAADRLAALMMLEFGPDVAKVTMRGAATFFADSRKTWTGSDFAEVRSPTVQRMFNYLCMAYGSDPQAFEGLASFLATRKDGERCKVEYLLGARAFLQVIAPHLDAAKLPAVQGMTIFEAGDF